MKDKIIRALNINGNFSKILIITIIFYYFKVAFWPLTYLFVASYALMLMLFLIRLDSNLGFSSFLQDFKIPIILAVVYIGIFLINHDFSNTLLQKDILLISVLFSFFYFLNWNNVILKQKISRVFLSSLIILATTIISFLNLVHLLFPSILSGKLLLSLNIPAGMSLANDSNFYCLFILFGLVILNFGNEIKNLKLKYSSVTRLLLSLIFILIIGLSGSRRGIIALLILLLIYLSHKFVKRSRHLIFSKYLKQIAVFTSVLFILSYAGLKIMKKVPKSEITFKLLKYSSLFGINDSNYINNLIWDPKNKISEETGKYYCKSESVIDIKYWRPSEKLVGLTNVETPFGKGLKIDKRTGLDSYFYLYYNGPAFIYLANHTYEISFKTKLASRDNYEFKAGWLVDDGGRNYSRNIDNIRNIVMDEDGWIEVVFNYTFIDNQIGAILFLKPTVNQGEFVISDIKIKELNFKPTQERIPIASVKRKKMYYWLNKTNPPIDTCLNLITNGDFRLGLAFWKYSADSLKIKIGTENNSSYAIISRGDGNGGYWSLYYAGRDIEFRKDNEYQIELKIKPIYPKTVPFNIGFEVDEGLGYRNNLPFKVDTLDDGWLWITTSYYFKQNHTKLAFPINNQINNSEFYLSEIILKNMTQPQFQTLTGDQSPGKSINNFWLLDRTERWNYASELWKNEYNFYNKLVGRGFNYLEKYGEKFMGDAKIYDWPHNPFISVLLYSGILGLLLYLWLLYNTIRLYFIYKNEYGLFFIGFILTFFFSFFSGSSPFDPPIMGFFILLPFFIHSIQKNDNQNINEKLTNYEDSNHRD